MRFSPPRYPCGWACSATRGHFDSECAREGVGLFNTLRSINAPGVVPARALLNTGASGEAAGVMEFVCDALHPPQVWDIKETFHGPRVARALSR